MNIFKNTFSITKMECVGPDENGRLSYEFRREFPTSQGVALILAFALFAIMAVFFHLSSVASGKGLLLPFVFDIEVPFLIFVGYCVSPPLSGVLKVTGKSIRWIKPDGMEISGLWTELVEVAPRGNRPWTLRFSDGTQIPLCFEKQISKFMEPVASCSGDESLLSLAWRDHNELIERKPGHELLCLFFLLLVIATCGYSGLCAIAAYYDQPPAFDFHAPIWLHVTINAIAWAVFLGGMRRTIARPDFLRRERLKAGRYRRL